MEISSWFPIRYDQSLLIYVCNSNPILVLNYWTQHLDLWIRIYRRYFNNTLMNWPIFPPDSVHLSKMQVRRMMPTSVVGHFIITQGATCFASTSCYLRKRTRGTRTGMQESEERGRWLPSTGIKRRRRPRTGPFHPLKGGRPPPPVTGGLGAPFGSSGPWFGLLLWTHADYNSLI